MLQPDRLGSRLRPWFLLLMAGLCFLLYTLIQAPFYDLGPYGIGAGVILSVALGVVLPLLVLTRRLGIPFRAQFQLERPEPVPALAVIAATLSLIPALEIVTGAMARRYPPDPAYLRFMEELRPESLPAFAVVLIALALAVPLAEELIFRGLLQRVLARHAGSLLALVLVAVLFGWVHPLYSVPGVILLGLFFGVLALVMGNLTYAIIAHAVWNLSNLLFLRQLGQDVETLLESPFRSYGPIWFLASALLFAFFSRFWWKARLS